jgi:membrane fusion protein (multidrug efflux system)
MTAEPRDSAVPKPSIFQHPVVMKVRALLVATGQRVAGFPPIRFLVRIVKAVAAKIAVVAGKLGSVALRVPLIRRGAAFAGEKMKIPVVRNMVYMLVIVGLFFGAIFTFEAALGLFISHIMAGIGKQAQTVSTVQATTQPWQKTFQAVGSLRAMNGADLSSEESGIVESINFNSGDEVQANTILLTLRAEDDIAKLASLRATAQLAEITSTRDQAQFKIQGVSQATLDTDAATLANDNALADQQQAVVDKKVIRAPFTGRLGIRAVDLGQYLNAGTAIVTLQALDRIYMDFYLPQQAVAEVQVGQTATIKVDTYPDTAFTGKITSINPLIDTSSRNLQVRATIANPDHKLLPGMYGTVSIDIGAPQNQVTLPQTALTYAPYGSTVYLVKSTPQTPSLWQRLWGTQPPPTLTVAQSFVKTGQTRGDQIEILSGVKDGDTVVGGGQIKLHNGSAITVNNSVLPTDAAAPTPTAEQ